MVLDAIVAAWRRVFTFMGGLGPSRLWVPPLEVWRFRTWKPPFLGERAVNFREGKVPKMMVFPVQKFTQSSSPLEVFLKGLEHMNLFLCLVSVFYFMRTSNLELGWYFQGCIGGMKIDAASFV